MERNLTVLQTDNKSNNKRYIVQQNVYNESVGIKRSLLICWTSSKNNEVGLFLINWLIRLLYKIQRLPFFWKLFARNMICLIIVSRGGWFGGSIVFQDDAMAMLLYWRKCLLLIMEKGNSVDMWQRRTRNMWWWRTTLIKFKRCYWMTASLYRKYHTFSDHESEQQHRTMTFVQFPNHPLLLTMVWLILISFLLVQFQIII